MGFFKKSEKKKTEEHDKLMNNLKKKEAQLEAIRKEEEKMQKRLDEEKEKIKEDIRKMAKLALKDGKLQPVEDTTDVPPAQPADDGYPQQMQQPMPPPPMPPPHMQAPPMQPPQQQRQQMPPPQMSQQPPVRVQIVLYDKSLVNIEVNVEELNGFMESIAEAISDQATFQIGNRILNGRYIVQYVIVG